MSNNNSDRTYIIDTNVIIYLTNNQLNIDDFPSNGQINYIDSVKSELTNIKSPEEAEERVKLLKSIAEQRLETASYFGLIKFPFVFGTDIPVRKNLKLKKGNERNRTIDAQVID